VDWLLTGRGKGPKSR